MMDIFKGKCVICCENSLVLSGKDKQTFIELLKEHYFDVNQIKNDKFKEKRSEKSLCISCAHIIECYVSIRNKFKEQGKRTAKKCFICNSAYNLTHGNNELVKDASILLKNVNEFTKVPRLTLFCLECSFCIISWNKLKDIITKYLLETEDSNESYSADDSSSASESSEMDLAKNKPSVRRTRKMTIEDRIDTAMNNGARKVKKSKSIKDTLHSMSKKKKLKIANEIEEQLKHLTNVSTQISSKHVLLGNKMIKRVTTDERMMFDIAHISCKTKNLESLLKNYDKSGNQHESSDKNLLVKSSCKRKSNYQSDDSYGENKPAAIKLKKKRLSDKQSEVSNDENQSSKNLESLRNKRKKASPKLPTKNVKTNNDNHSPEMTENKRRKSPRKNKSFDESEVILLSDTDSEPDPKSKKKSVNITPVRMSLRTRSSRRARMQKENNKREIKNKAASQKNQCSSCDKSFVKKYRLQLHELEHEASFRPVVRVRKGGKKKSSDSEGKSSTDDSEVDENQIKDKQATENNNVKKSSQKEKDEEKESADENEILDDSIKQVVNERLLQLEKDIDENSKKTPDKKDENQKSSFSQDEETAYSDISDGDKNTDHAKKKPKNNEKVADIDDEKDDDENNGTKEDNTNSEEQTETADKNADHTKKNPKNNVKDIDSGIEKDDSTKEDNSNSEDQTNTSNKNSGIKEKINEEIETQDSENETNDEMTQQSDKETNDEIQEKINEETESQVPENTSRNTKGNVKDINQTNEETKKDKNDKADSVQCDKQIEKNSQDSDQDDSSNNSDKNVDNNVVEINEENNVIKQTSGLKSVVIEDDSSNSSDKDDEIEKDKLIEENNQQSVVIDVDSSDSSDKEEETEKDKTIEENESLVIEDSLSNSDRIEEDTVTQNTEEPVNDITESSQTEINDKDTLKDNENNVKLNNEMETAEICEAGNESEDTLQSTDKTILVEEDEMEPLHISPESVNSQNGKSYDNALQKTLDKYETVESLLQNLGA